MSFHQVSPSLRHLRQRLLHNFKLGARVTGASLSDVPKQYIFLTTVSQGIKYIYIYIY